MLHPHTEQYGVRVSGARSMAPHGAAADKLSAFRRAMKQRTPGGYLPIGGGSPAAAITNTDLLERIDAALKAITTTSLGDAILVPEQADRFIQTIEESTWILERFRRIPMGAPQRNIDRTDFSSGILGEPVAEGAEFTAESAPDFFTNVLAAAKARGRAAITDEAMRDGIERGNFESTLVDMIARRAGRDLQRLYVRGDTTGAGFLSLIDGWLNRAATSITGVASATFDPTAVEDMFESMLLALDSKYVEGTDRSGWVFVVTFKVENDYRNVLKARGTQLGDTAQTENRPLLYKGIEVRNSAAVPDGRALLTHEENTVYGIYQDIEIERERKPAFDRTDFHVRVRTDADYEDENAAVAATGYTGPA